MAQGRPTAEDRTNIGKPVLRMKDFVGYEACLRELIEMVCRNQGAEMVLIYFENDADPLSLSVCLSVCRVETQSLRGYLLQLSSNAANDFGGRK